MKKYHIALPMWPPFRDGELLNSFMMRAIRTISAESLALAFKKILERKPGLDGMPNGLDDFRDIVGNSYGDIDHIINRHTEIFFYCCGLPKEKFERQRKRLRGRFNGPTRLCRLPLMFSPREGFYLYCPECEALQLEGGFGFAHRRCCGPFLYMCFIHGIPLRPRVEQLLLFDAQCMTVPTSSQQRYGIELAKRVDYCMETPTEISVLHKDMVIANLGSQGWMGSNGCFHLAKFINAFGCFFGGRFADARLEFLVTSEKHIHDALRALLRADRGLHPLWCVLFAWFAEECAYPTAAPQKTVPKPRVHRSEEEIRVALDECGSLRKASSVLGLNISRLSCLCSRYGIATERLGGRLDPALLVQINAAFDKGMTPADVAIRFRISQTKAYRIMAGRPRGNDLAVARQVAVEKRAVVDKQLWLDTISAHPSMTTTALRRMHPALWVRLRRYAPDWLKDHPGATAEQCLRRRRRARPAELLRRLEAAIHQAAGFCVTAAPRPQRRSVYRVRKKIGISESTFNCLSPDLNTPWVPDTYVDFVERRIDWATRSGKRRKLKDWAIAKKAGLRTETVRRRRINFNGNGNAVDGIT